MAKFKVTGESADLEFRVEDGEHVFTVASEIGYTTDAEGETKTLRIPLRIEDPNDESMGGAASLFCRLDRTGGIRRFYQILYFTGYHEILSSKYKLGKLDVDGWEEEWMMDEKKRNKIVQDVITGLPGYRIKAITRNVVRKGADGVERTYPNVIRIMKTEDTGTIPVSEEDEGF